MSQPGKYPAKSKKSKRVNDATLKQTQSKNNSTKTSPEPLPAPFPVPSGKKRKTQSEDHQPSDHARSKRRNISNHTEDGKSGRVRQKKSGAKTSQKEIINTIPSQTLEIYCFGGGENGELGFGGQKGTTNIPQPRLNPLLTPDKAGVVQFSVGGMHTAALTSHNKILTWGVNDLGALGRDTSWEEPLREIKDNNSDSGSTSDSDEGDINPLESTPTEVDLSALSETPIFTQVACSDNATFALTDTGLVYGWGTFQGPQGVYGFSRDTLIQLRPKLIAGLKKIKKLVCGENHVMALDHNGYVYAWGAGHQNQLGRRIVERHQLSSLTPERVGIPRDIVEIGGGQFHSFAVCNNGDVYSWGLGNFGQTGNYPQLGELRAGAHLPQVVQSLRKFGKVISITGGNHHSVAATDRGECLVWGRADAGQMGIDLDKVNPENLVMDFRNRPSILTVPTPVPGIDAVTVAAGTDHSIALDRKGNAYSWGFNEYGQTGIRATDQVDEATLLRSKAIQGVRVVQADCGGQFSVIGAIPGTDGLQ